MRIRVRMGRRVSSSAAGDIGASGMRVGGQGQVDILDQEDAGDPDVSLWLYGGWGRGRRGTSVV